MPCVCQKPERQANYTAALKTQQRSRGPPHTGTTRHQLRCDIPGHDALQQEELIEVRLVRARHAAEQGRGSSQVVELVVRVLFPASEREPKASTTSTTSTVKVLVDTSKAPAACSTRLHSHPTYVSRSGRTGQGKEAHPTSSMPTRGIRSGRRLMSGRSSPSRTER